MYMVCLNAKVRNEIDSDIFGSLSKTYTEEKAELNAKIADLILQENSAKDAYQKTIDCMKQLKNTTALQSLLPKSYLILLTVLKLANI